MSGFFFQGGFLAVIHAFRFFFLKQNFDSEQNQFKIQPEGIIFYICQVQFDFVVRHSIILSIDLCVSGKSGFHFQTETELGNALFIFLRNLFPLRPWSYKRHIAQQHIKQLRQFIKMKSADNFPHRRNPVVMFACQPGAPFFRFHNHTAEFINRKRSAVLCNPFLHIQHRTAVI